MLNHHEDHRAGAKPMRDLWSLAEKSLRQDPDPEKRNLIEKYFQILQSELAGDDNKPTFSDNGHTQISRMACVLNQKMEELINWKLTISLGSHGVAIENLFNKVVKHVIAAKDLINGAAGADPHAALACGGALVLLTLLIRPVEQREQLLKGLELTSSLMCRYAAMEQIYCRRAHLNSLSEESAASLEADLQNCLVNLYANILELQARAACYLHRSRTSQFIRDALRDQTWKDLIQTIYRCDDHCRSYASLIADENLLSRFDAQTELVANFAHSALQQAETLPGRRNKLLETLYQCPYEDRKDINIERSPGTCDWFSDHPYFRNWYCNSKSRLLWVSADPGCGKSVLARYLVDVALQQRGQQNLCYFFFKDDYDDQRSAAGALCALIRQLLVKNRSLMNAALLDKFDSDGSFLLESTTRLFAILLDLSKRAENEVVCVLDALDECRPDDSRQLLALLHKLFIDQPPSCNIKFLITSRPYPDIQRGLQRLQNAMPTIHLKGEDETQVEKISGEIDVFIRNRIKEIEESLNLEPTETDFLAKRLLGTRNRTYLWLKLALDVIENILSFTESDVEDALNNIPEGLDRLYDKILSRSLDVTKARKVIRIIVAARTPLSVSRMSVALGINECHRDYNDIKLEPLNRFAVTLRSICGLFVTVVKGRVYFLHQTAREFLLRPDDQSAMDCCVLHGDLTWKHAVSTKEAHSVMATICALDYCLPIANSYRLYGDRLSLREYSKAYWDGHCREVHPPQDSLLVEATVKLCRKLAADGNSFCSTLRMRTALSIASFYGLKSAAQSILAQDAEAHSSVDGNGKTALYYAASNGQNELVQLLLETDDTTGYREIALNNFGDGPTPLEPTVKACYTSTIEILLLDRRLRVTGRQLRNAISWALSRNSTRALTLLMSNSPWRAQLPESEKLDLFEWALTQDNTSIAILFATSIRPSSRNRSRPNSFLLALFVISQQVVGRTFDAGNEYLKILRAIHDLGHVEPFAQDDDGQTAVHFAARMGRHPQILRYLVFELGLPIDSAETHSCRWSPSFTCAALGYLDGLGILFETKRVNINATDVQGRTLLMVAVSNLLDRWKLAPPTALVRLILSKGADVGLKDAQGYTALMYAAADGYRDSEDAIDVLLRHGADVNARNNHGETALTLAAQKGYATAVEILLKAGADCRCRDRDGLTPYDRAKREFNRFRHATHATCATSDSNQKVFFLPAPAPLRSWYKVGLMLREAEGTLRPWFESVQLEYLVVITSVMFLTGNEK